MTDKITIAQIQDNHGAFEVTEDDVCSTCRHCAYVTEPDKVSLCLRQFGKQVFTPRLDEDSNIYECDQHAALQENESNVISE